MPVESSDLEAAALRYAQLSERLPARHRCLTSCTWVSDPTAILLLWFREIQCWRSTAQTLRLPAYIKEGAG
jgi:hypothetical protein